MFTKWMCATESRQRVLHYQMDKLEVQKWWYNLSRWDSDYFFILSIKSTKSKTIE